MTRFLVLSDVHSNLEALEATIAAARALGYDRALVLGDIVGYGADPNAVIERLRDLPGLLAIRGNHDRVAAGLEDGEGFNEAARQAALWTRRALTPESRAFLEGLPRGPVEFAPGKILCHGSPLDEDAYLLDEGEARLCFEAADFRLAFFGHSHFPGVFALDAGAVRRLSFAGEEATIEMRSGPRYLVNPGSVGQPRDRDPRCGFALYDEATERVTVFRKPYAAEEARGKILGAGLPRWLGDRLLIGA